MATDWLSHETHTHTHTHTYIFELFQNDFGGRNESKLLALVNFLVPKVEFKIYSK